MVNTNTGSLEVSVTNALEKKAGSMFHKYLYFGSDFFWVYMYVEYLHFSFLEQHLEVPQRHLTAYLLQFTEFSPEVLTVDVLEDDLGIQLQLK